MTGKRCPNFSLDEKQLLFRLVAENKDVIDSKKTDSVTMKEKDAAWIKVWQVFNVLSTSNRELLALKTCYHNVKKRSKVGMEDIAKYEEPDVGIRNNPSQDELDALLAASNEVDSMQREEDVVKKECDSDFDSDSDFVDPLELVESTVGTKTTMVEEPCSDHANQQDCDNINQDADWTPWQQKQEHDTTASKKNSQLKRKIDAEEDASFSSTRLKLLQVALDNLKQERLEKKALFKERIEIARLVRKQEEIKLILLQKQLKEND